LPCARSSLPTRPESGRRRRPQGRNDGFQLYRRHEGLGADLDQGQSGEISWWAQADGAGDKDGHRRARCSAAQGADWISRPAKVTELYPKRPRVTAKPDGKGKKL